MKYFIIDLDVALGYKLEYRIKTILRYVLPRIIEYKYRPSDQSSDLS